ncbi:hypothetical protein K8R62_04240 [bacterium]|nr:hypothetical protein [bacterium]
MFEINKYKHWIYLILFFLVSSLLLYSFWFLYQNFYLPIGWADNTDLYKAGSTKRVNIDELDNLFNKIESEKEQDNENREIFSCLDGDCKSFKRFKVSTTLVCNPSMGVGFGADCIWTSSEIHLDHDGDPNKNFMVYESNEAVEPTSLSMKWPSIVRCDAYQVYVSGDGENWFSLGNVPSPSACPQENKTVLGEYDVSNVDFKVKYIKIAKLYDNEGDDSLDTPAEVTLTGFVEREVENSAVKFCIP